MLIMVKLMEYDESVTCVTVLKALFKEYDDIIELDRLGFSENWLELLNPHY
jgi:hypothetical protein